jgi:hypothetical protein
MSARWRQPASPCWAGSPCLIALAGLKRLSPDIDPAQVPAWFWYFRDDPLVRRWVGVGLLSTFGGAGMITLGVVRNRRPPLHGAARWASEAELVGAGLRSPPAASCWAEGAADSWSSAVRST